MEVIESYLKAAHRADLDPHHYVVLEKAGVRAKIECEQRGDIFDVINFGSNDILGMAQHPRVTRAAMDAIASFGTSNSSCATLSGRIALHRDLEREMGAFKGLPHTYLFLNAWMALQAVLDGFCHLAVHVPGFRHTRETLVMTDLYNHGCITSAVVNADNRSGKIFGHSPKVRTKVYRHNDSADLKRRLERFYKPGNRLMVISDAVFSMDGDIAPVPEMVEVLSHYPGAVLLLDEAHSSGALGATGKGILEHFQLTPQDIKARGVEPIILTTFSKFAGSAGAAISSFSEAFRELLDASPTSIGTISLPPANAAATLAAVRRLRDQPQLVDDLRQKSALLRGLLGEAGFETLGETQVVPVILPENISPKAFARYLLEKDGIWISAVWFISKPRLRIVVTTMHGEEDLRFLVAAMIKARAALGGQAAQLEQPQE